MEADLSEAFLRLCKQCEMHRLAENFQTALTEAEIEAERKRRRTRKKKGSADPERLALGPLRISSDEADAELRADMRTLAEAGIISSGEDLYQDLAIVAGGREFRCHEVRKRMTYINLAKNPLTYRK